MGKQICQWRMDNWKLIPYKYFRQFGKNWLILSMNIEYKKIKDSVLTAVSIVDNNDYGEFRNSTAFHFDSGEVGNSTAGKLIMM